MHHPPAPPTILPAALGGVLIALGLATAPVGAQEGGQRRQQERPAPPAAQQQQNRQPAPPGGANRPAGGAQQPPPQGGNRPAAGQPNNNRTNTAARPAAGGSNLGELKLNIDRDARLLRLLVRGQEDRGTGSVLVGDEFITDAVFENEAGLGIDAVRVLLSYQTDFVEPIAINDSPIAGVIKGQPVSEVDVRRGAILYEAELSEPLVFKSAPIVSIRWRALQPSARTVIEFGKREDLFTTLNLNGEDMLGNRRVAGDGTLNLSLSVLPRDPREARALLNEPTIFLNPEEKIGDVRLSLVRQPEPVVAGRPFTIDLVLDNRAFSMLDALNVLITYDPAVLRIIDTDHDNLITRETNLHDGPFRRDFNWDFHIDNTVFHERGQIVYRVGTTDASMTRGKFGTIARIHAVAVRPTAATAIEFSFRPTARRQSTRVTYVGADVLGDPNVPDDGATGIVLEIAAPGAY
jgi:hypothetical protein